MSLVDQYGQPVADIDDSWMVAALFTWLGNPRVRKRAIDQRVATAQGIRVIGGLLDLELQTRLPQHRRQRRYQGMGAKVRKLDRKIVLRAMVDLISNRVCRLALVTMCAQDEVDAYERDPKVAAYPRAWQAGGLKSIKEELQKLRLELEAQLDGSESRTLIVGV